MVPKRQGKRSARASSPGSHLKKRKKTQEWLAPSNAPISAFFSGGDGLADVDLAPCVCSAMSAAAPVLHRNRVLLHCNVPEMRLPAAAAAAPAKLDADGAAVAGSAWCQGNPHRRRRIVLRFW